MQSAPMTTVLGTAGPCPTLTYKGVEYPLGPPTPRLLARVENMVGKLASADLAALKPSLPPEEYDQFRADLGAMMRAGEYKTFGRLWAEQFNAEGGKRGMSILLFCSMEEGRELSKNPRAMPELLPFSEMMKVLRDSPDAKEVAAMVLPDFFRAAGASLDLPPEKMQAIEEVILKTLAKLAEA